MNVAGDNHGVPLRDYIEAMFREKEKQVDAALAANEKRLDALNELRGTLEDMGANQVPRAEFMLAIKQANARLEEQSKTTDARIADLKGSNRAGASSLWAYIVGAVGVLALAVSLFTGGG